MCAFAAVPLVLQVRSLRVHTQTKTKDNIITDVMSVAMFKVNPAMCKEAHFKMTNADQLMTGHVVRFSPFSLILFEPPVHIQRSDHDGPSRRKHLPGRPCGAVCGDLLC